MMNSHEKTGSDFRNASDTGIVSFDTFSEIYSEGNAESGYSAGLPSKTRFTVLVLDMKNLTGSLVAEKTIPLHVNGTTYSLDMHEITRCAEDQDTGLHLFTGYLEDPQTGVRINSTKADMTIYDETSMSGSICTDASNRYNIEALHSANNTRSFGTLHIAYSTAGLLNEGDAIIVMPAGEGRTYCQLTTEETEWLISEQCKRQDRIHD
jgi:hypothetical protein